MRRGFRYAGLGIFMGALSAPCVTAFGRDGGVPYFGTDLVQVPSTGSPIGLSPPDSAGAVSKKFIVATANTRISIYDIKGQPLVPATEIASSRTGFLATACKNKGSDCGDLELYFTDFPNHRASDPRVVYDPKARRWYVSHILFDKYPESQSGVSDGRLALIVSTSSDPTKPWRAVVVPSDPVAGDQFWGDYTQIGFSKDKIVIALNLFPINRPNEDDVQTGIYIFDKRKAMKGVWSHQAIVPPLSAVDFEYQSQFGFTPNPAVDVDGVSKEAYLVSSTTNDPDFNLRITALTGLPPDVAFSTQQLLSNKFAYPVDIPQPVIGRPIAGGDARVSSNPVLRVTKIKGERKRQLRLYAIHTIANEAETLDGFRVYTVRVSKNKSSAVFALENSVDLFTQSDLFYTYSSLAVQKNGLVGVGYSVMEGDVSTGAGLTTINPTTGDIACVTPTKGTTYNGTNLLRNLNRWGDYSATVAALPGMCPKTGGFCSFQERAKSERVWQVVAGCYCVDSFGTCEDLALSVSAGSFAGSSAVPVVASPKPSFPWEGQ